MLRIERTIEPSRVLVRVSGRIETDHIGELERALVASKQAVVLDLSDVSLVDRDVVPFLASCEMNGVKLEQCPPYLRQWITRCRSQP